MTINIELKRASRRAYYNRHKDELKLRSLCVHNKKHAKCRECGGSAFCEHDRQKYRCKECGCGTNKFEKNAFTKDEIKLMGAVKHCQFPNCSVEMETLHSDHFHDGRKINRNNYRGEVCFGHNWILSVLDDRPELASPEELEYMNRRPFKENFDESSDFQAGTV